VQVEQIRGTGEVVAMRQNHSALEKQLEALQQLLVSEREARQIQWATRSRKSGPTGAVVPPPPPSQVFNFGGVNSQQPLPPAQCASGQPTMEILCLGERPQREWHPRSLRMRRRPL
jgi:hypothetical protein